MKKNVCVDMYWHAFFNAFLYLMCHQTTLLTVYLHCFHVHFKCVHVSCWKMHAFCIVPHHVSVLLCEPGTQKTVVFSVPLLWSCKEKCRSLHMMWTSLRWCKSHGCGVLGSCVRAHSYHLCWDYYSQCKDRAIFFSFCGVVVVCCIQYFFSVQ